MTAVEAAPAGVDPDTLTLSEVVARILFDDAFRSAVADVRRSGDEKQLVRLVGVRHARHLRRTDAMELVQVGSRIRHEILNGSASTGLGLRGHFPGSLSLLNGLGCSERAAAIQFMGSTHFADVRDVPLSAGGKGVSLPEAFLAHLCDEGYPAAVLSCAKVEAMAAIAEIYAAGGAATFRFTSPGTEQVGPLLVCVAIDEDDASRAQLWLAGASRYVHGVMSLDVLSDLLRDIQRGAAFGFSSCRPEIRSRLRRWRLIDG